MKTFGFDTRFLLNFPCLTEPHTWQMFRLFLFAILLSNSLYLPAQNDPHPAFHQYTTDDGLASPEVFDILQDQEGYIWIASDNGVSRFDGYEFRNYGLKDGLLENVIFELRMDTLKRLWMQAMSGNLYYMEGDSIRSYWNNDKLLNFKDRAETKGFIVEGGGEMVHISSKEFGVISISKNGTATSTPHKKISCKLVFEKNGIAIDAFFTAHEAKRKPFAAENEDYLNEGHPVYFHINEEVDSITGLFYSKKEDPNTEIFRLDEGKYLLQISDVVWYIEDRIVRWQRPFPPHIKHAALMKNGQLYLGLSRHLGLRIYKSIDAFQEKKGSTWLPGKTVNYFIEDREGGCWFASHEDGVFYIPANAFMVHDQETGLSDEKVRVICIKNELELFVGLENGEVWHLNGESRIWSKLPRIPSKGSISDLYFDTQSQQLWAGRDELFYLQKNKWVKSTISDPGLSKIIANRIIASPDRKRLWLPHYRGFRSIELPSKKLDTVNVHTRKDQRTYVVREDFAGRIWVGLTKGLFEWKEGVLHNRDQLHSLFSLRVEDIALMRDSTLVVASKGGGLVFWKGKKFKWITTKDGLTADMMECLYADETGVLWAGTLNGLNRITGIWDNWIVEQITISHGLPSNEISRIRTYGEDVWVATSKGLVHISNKSNSPNAPQPFLTSVLANNSPINVHKPVKLHSKQNNLVINYSGINYSMNGKIPYRYRMDGDQWTSTQNRSLNFPDLPPGERFFEVQARNEDGDWSKSARFQFVINPPWWATIWARIGAFILLLSLVLMVYQYRTGQLKKKNKIQLKIAALERSALQAQMNPHFIFNCLNSIQNYILQNEKEAAIMYLGSFASLVRSMLNASVAGEILLVEEVKLLTNYLELEKMRFGDRFTFEVVIAESLDTFEVKIPPLLVQPYVENALLHGIFGKTSGGKVAVSFDKKEDYLEVSILDNGGGFEEKEAKAKNSKNYKSFGMSITRNRLELLSNKKDNNHVSYKTLYDTNGLVVGTKATIRIGIEENLKNKE